jgi:CheY-like chemotaxis protein
LKILIAEDEPGIAETYQKILEDRGHLIRVASDGKECLRAYENAVAKLPKDTEDYLANHPPFDAVVLDYRMPVMNGLECARGILGINKHQRIIFVSAYVMSTLKESVKQLHMATELIQKPIDLDEFADIIEDKRIYEELKKINVKINTIKEFNPTHEQLVDLLDGLSRLRASMDKDKKDNQKAPKLSPVS